MKGTFIEAKNIYRVENEDGTFDTYTPEQYKKKFGEEEEEVVYKNQDGDVISSDDDVYPPSAEEEVEVAFYKLLEPVPYMDEDGVESGKFEAGEVVEVPEIIGDVWVTEGKAVKVEKENTNTNQD